MTFDNPMGNIVQLGYQQIPSLDVDEVTVQTIFKAYKNIYIDTYHDYSMESGLMFTQGYGVRYIRGCWGVGAGYERVGADNRFVFTIDLLGIGSLGQGSFFGRPLFGESLPGYQHPETWILFKIAQRQLRLPASHNSAFFLHSTFLFDKGCIYCII